MVEVLDPASTRESLSWKFSNSNYTCTLAWKLITDILLYQENSTKKYVTMEIQQKKLRLYMEFNYINYKYDNNENYTNMEKAF
jgi:hypothetical protein